MSTELLQNSWNTEQMTTGLNWDTSRLDLQNL